MVVGRCRLRSDTDRLVLVFRSEGKRTPSPMIHALVLSLELDCGGSAGTIAAPDAIEEEASKAGGGSGGVVGSGVFVRGVMR